jgi:hypothetical protein
MLVRLLVERLQLAIVRRVGRGANAGETTRRLQLAIVWRVGRGVLDAG